MNFLFLQLIVPLFRPKTNTLVRKEIRDLSIEEWNEFKDAFLNLKKHGILEDLAELHACVENYAHNHPRFLPWHRAFLIYFENLLQLINQKPHLTVPYWDWTIDSDTPQNSFIFKEFYWGIEKCFDVSFPNKHCLKRNDFKIDPFYSKPQLNRLINKKMTYNEFREGLELVPHAIVHFNIGGSDGDMSMMYSTNDPIFWHHHSFIDYVWHLKQEKNLKNNYDGEGANLNEILRPFGKMVREVLDLRACKISYKAFTPVRIMSLSVKPGKISEEYAKRHGYDIAKVREIEKFLTNEKKKQNLFIRILKVIFCIK